MMRVPTAEEVAELSRLHDGMQDREGQGRFYVEELLPALCAYFAGHPGADPLIEILLIPVSNPHTPILSAARWKPRIVFAIYSSRSAEHRSFIEERIGLLGLGIETRGEVVQNIEIEPNRLYEAINRVLRPFLRSEERVNQHIATDITGGTSVMSVGAAMAVSLVGGRLVYVLSSTAKDDIQNRLVGTAQPRLLDDPVAFFDLEANQARRSFAEHDYTEARRIFTELGGRSSLPDAPAYRAYSVLADVYVAWEAFDFGHALTRLTVLARETLPRALFRYSERLTDQCAALERINTRIGVTSHQGRERVAALSDTDYVTALLGSLWAHAERRQQQERYDVAAVLLYRCLELMVHHRLALLGRLAQDKRSPGLKPGYEALERVSDGLVSGLPFGTIEASIDDARHASFLGHGYRRVSEKEWAPLGQVVTGLLRRLLEINSLDIAGWEETHRFISPFAPPASPDSFLIGVEDYR